jgi:hypothetical protein
MLFAGGCALLWPGLVLDATGTAVVGNAPVVDNRVSLHNCAVDIGGVNDGLIHAHHRSVIGKLIAAPLAARKADATVAVTVVHAAVVAHVTAPVALMEPVAPTGPAPIMGRPQCAFIGRLHPRTRNPEVIAVPIGPITWNPNQVGLRAIGLFVDGQYRRRKAYRDGDLRMR